LLLSLAFAPAASGADSFESTVSQEVSAGGMVRLLKRDQGLVGGGNGGTGTSINYDDGNLNYDRGFTSWALQGRTTFEASSGRAEIKLEAVYFYDFVASDVEFRSFGDAARKRVGQDLYLNEAYLGYGGLRLGNQILRWSESASFGPSIAPVNPVSLSRRYQPGNTAKDAYVALPMLSARLQTRARWTLEGFYQLGFEPTESEAAGTFLSGNDYYSPGGRFIQLGQGSPLVPDTDMSVVTPATPFGSKVPRTADREPGADGQFGARVESPGFGTASLAISAYAMRVHSREPIVSLNTGTLSGLQGTGAPDYTSSGSYFVEYPRHVTVVGSSARFLPAKATRISVDYSMRLRQPLQIDDDALITAGLAPAAATAACAPNPSSPACGATLAALNANPVIAARGGITAANAANFFNIEMSGYQRFDVSQYAASLSQGLPPILGAGRWSVAAEVGGMHVHEFKEGLLDASVSIRPDSNGRRRVGLATRSAWGYRIGTRLDYPDTLGMQSVSPSVTWIHDVDGKAPITLGTLLEGNKGVILAADLVLENALTARLSYRSYLGKGSDADRYSDRDFLAFSVTKKF
jgi:hypothetical protein